jgi:hypothetical protein
MLKSRLSPSFLGGTIEIRREVRVLSAFLYDLLYFVVLRAILGREGLGELLSSNTQCSSSATALKLVLVPLSSARTLGWKDD